MEKKNSLVLPMLALLIGGIVVLSCHPLIAEAQTRASTSFLAFTDSFDTYNTTLWHKGGWLDQWRPLRLLVAGG